MHSKIALLKRISGYLTYEMKTMLIIHNILSSMDSCCKT